MTVTPSRDFTKLATMYPFAMSRFVTPGIEAEAAKLIQARVKAESRSPRQLREAREKRGGRPQSLGFADDDVLREIGEAEVQAADLAIHFGISTTSMLNRLGAMHARGLVVKSGDRHRGVFWRAAE